MTTPADVTAFKDFERAGWETAAGSYPHAFGDLTTQVVEPLLDAVAVGPGTTLLDVATGPGYVAAAAARRGATVVGVDFSAAMLVEARRRHPDLDLRPGDAEALPFPDAAFDALTMNFGLLHLGDPDRALAEACRVLRPGGRLAATVWATPDKAVAFGIVLGALQVHGRMDVPLPPGPSFFRFADAAECRRAFAAAGFAEPTVTEVPQVWRLPSPDALLTAMRESTVRTAGMLRAQSPAALAAIAGAVRVGASGYAKGDTVDLPMPAVLIAAQKR